MITTIKFDLKEKKGDMSDIPLDFKNFISQFMDNWRTIDIRVLAWKIEIGWLFHQIRIVLDSKPVKKPTFEDIPKIENLLAIHERWDINKLNQLLDSLETAELEIGGETIHIKTWNGQLWKPLNNLSYRYHDKDNPFQKYGINYMSCSLQGYSSRQVNYNEKEIINHQLRTYKHPWDGLKDLRMNFIGLNEQWSSLDNSNLAIIAPIFLKINEIQLENKDIIVNIEKSDMIKFEDILLSIISQYEYNDISRINQPIIQNKTIVKLNNTPVKSKIMINYRKHVPDSKEIYGYTTNQRVKIFQELSGDIQDLLEDVPEKGRRSSRNFEVKISLLFHILGFSPAYYGFGSDDVPDVLVFDKDNKSVMVIECTLLQPDINNKLSKLSSRTKNIELIIPDIQVLPILITALSRDRINKSDEDKAETEAIAIITSNEFDSLITMGLEQASATEIFDYIHTLIPHALAQGDTMRRLSSS